MTFTPNIRDLRRHEPWSTVSDDRTLPGLRSTGLQWGEYLRSLGPEKGIRLTPSDVVTEMRIRGFQDVEIAKALQAFRAPSHSLPRWPEYPDCPDPKRIALVDLRQRRFTAPSFPCERWRCGACGPAKVALTAHRFTEHFEITNGAWVTDFEHSAVTTATVRQRRLRARRDGHDVRGTTLRVGDQRYEFCSVALGGQADPQTGEWMTPGAVGEYVAHVLTEGSALPVRLEAGYGDWPPEESPRAASANFVLLGLDRPGLVTEVENTVRLQAVAHFGVDPADEGWMSQLPGSWLRTAMEAARDAVEQ